jgi:hypothetical protein
MYVWVNFVQKLTAERVDLEASWHQCAADISHLTTCAPEVHQQPYLLFSTSDPMEKK